MRAADRNAEELAGEHVACRLTAADYGCTRAVDTGVRSLRAAKAKFQHAVSAGRLHDARGFGGDQRLVVDDVEQRGFQQLRFHNRRDDTDDRFARKDDRAFRNGQNLARKAQRSQTGEKRFVKDIQASQIGDILI